jgi:hypothetical protein
MVIPGNRSLLPTPPHIHRLMKRPAFLDEADAALGEEAAEGYGDATGSGGIP